MQLHSSAFSRIGLAALALAVVTLAMRAALPALAADDAEQIQKATHLVYPESRRGDTFDDYHGTSIADPYRWLEDPDSEETKAWVAAQNEVTFSYLRALPERKAFQQRLTELWNYERFGLPRHRSGKYFYTRNDGLQNQSVLYVTDGLGGEPRMLIDPNTWSDDGTVALAGWTPSDDGALLAYGVADAGSDWRTWKVLDVATGNDLGDELRWVKFSGVSWTPDGKGLYYSRYDEPAEGDKFTGTNYYQKLYYHRLGEPQASDALIYQRDDQKEWGFGGDVSEDGRLLSISVWRGAERKNQIFLKRLSTPDAAVEEIISGFDHEYELLGNEGNWLYLLTDHNAPRRRVIAVDIDRPGQAHWREIIAETDDTLEGASLVGDRLFAIYLHDARNVVNEHRLDGTLIGPVELPGLGTVGGFGGRRDATETFFVFTNFTSPGVIYRYDLATRTSEVFRQPKVDFDADRYETRQVFVESSDGARVPMFITHRRGIELDNSHPTILYAYGGFNISLTPAFSTSTAAWLEKGGIYAMANLRGGGEYGSRWHEAGMLLNKQNVFDDFLASAEWLIANGYTSREHLGIRGGSNGGLLVGAAITQRPDLFAAAAPSVGVMDMLRFHKFTIGWAWVPEYGSSDDPIQFQALLKYSPLHNLREGTSYPATLITTADHDDRVVPAHSFKFAAAIQAAHRGTNPVLIRIETRAGHGAGKPTAKVIEESADVLSFFWHELDGTTAAE